MERKERMHSFLPFLLSFHRSGGGGAVQVGGDDNLVTCGYRNGVLEPLVLISSKRLSGLRSGCGL
ncbi:hypothetical protein, partial [Mycolicibacter arupensis]|uniref:hypothetical protein n=1 Tax=Mycolicibacter arupensis TaxID=342002 RepID=UPI001CB7473B